MIMRRTIRAFTESVKAFRVRGTSIAECLEGIVATPEALLTEFAEQTRGIEVLTYNRQNYLSRIDESTSSL